MLEMFFDNEKVFSVLEKILKADEEKINVVKICYDLNIPVDIAGDIIQDLCMLEIIKVDGDDLEHVELNLDSEILLAICILDDIVGKFFLRKMKKSMIDEIGQENGDFQDLLKGVNVEEISLEDFLKIMSDE